MEQTRQTCRRYRNGDHHDRTKFVHRTELPENQGSVVQAVPHERKRFRSPGAARHDAVVPTKTRQATAAKRHRF